MSRSPAVPRRTPACPPRRLPSMLLPILCLVIAAGMPRASADPTSTAPPRGLRENTPQLHAIVNARVVTSPGQVIERATIVFRDGVILSVGPSEAVSAPADARVHDLAGRTVYAGFIDAFSEPATGGAAGRATGAAPALGRTVDSPNAPTAAAPSGGAAHWSEQIQADFRADRGYRPDADLNRRLRAQGVVARLVVPTRGIVKGTSAVVETSDHEATEAILRPQAAQHLALTPSRRGPPTADDDEDRYPSSPMGALTLVRQTLYDAQWYARAWAASAQNRTLPHPQRNAALDALSAQLESKLPFVVDANDELYALRAARLAGEFKIPVLIRGSGQEYRRIDAIIAAGLPIILPVNFPRAPNVASPELALNVSLTDLMDWDLAPENPARLDAAGVKLAFSTHGLRDRGEFLKGVRRAVARGLPRDSALRALTTTPARLLNVDSCLGTLEPGKCASFVVTDGDVFDDKTKIVETWVDGSRYEVQPRMTIDPRGTWRVTGAVEGSFSPFDVKIAGEPGRFRGDLVKPGAATTPASTATTESTPVPDRPAADRRGRDAAVKSLAVDDTRVAFNLDGESVGQSGIVQVSGVFSTEGDRWTGALVKADGSTVAVSGERVAGPSAATEPATAPATRASTRPASYAVNFPLGDFGRETTDPEQPRVVLFRNATVWTAADAGVLDATDVRVESGRIAAIGKNLPVPDGAVVIDCTGRFLAPGIIDCHSHMATDGGVNESGQNISAETRIGDFIDPDDINLYRQLAAGVTSANILHGSANAIGGQNQVIKLRWGAGPEELKLANAPAGIKFALGENPKQANWNIPEERRNRYPQSRMGVDQLIRNAFAAARDYRAAQQRFAADPRSSLPVRTDLELEAIAEILEGTRWVHCHSYRQDEILAFLRTCEAFGVKIGSLQHILEGYKVANAIAKHGAMASAFADWWAFKIEVYDAIPYNGALMHNAGVVVSFNSDDAEMARRLNTEAAKATKYGGVKPEDAIRFVTLNPARQLRIDDRVGSIEVGKDADLAVWSAPPMSTYARCEQTWIDGRKYFDRADDAALRQRDAAMRQALIQKILASGEPLAGDDDTPPRERTLWPRHDEFCFHGHDENE